MNFRNESGDNAVIGHQHADRLRRFPLRTSCHLAGTVNITVTNPAGGGTSNAQTFTINNPAPTETSISQTCSTAGVAALKLTVNVTGIVSSSVVKFNGAAKDHHVRECHRNG